MDKEEAKKVMEDLLNATKDFLIHAVNKSGIRYDLTKLSSAVSFIVGDMKTRSVFMGEYISPSEENPNGEIRMYLDAIIDYAAYLGVDYWSMAAKVLFCQMQHAIGEQNKRAVDYDKAEKFGSKVCKKLHKQKIISDLRPKFYIPQNDRVNLVARQKWIERWLGMSLDEAVGILTKEVPQTESTDTP